MFNSKKYFAELKVILDKLDFGAIDKFAKLIWEAGQKDKTIFFIGNGGSAATASHMAADIGKNTGYRFRALGLTDNVAWMTALGNDEGYENIFVEQLKNFANKGDLLVAVTGSGNSGNVIKAMQWARKNKVKTIGVLGFSGGKAKALSDLVVLVPVAHYGYVEGIHSEIQHYVVEALKEYANIYKKGR